MNLNILKLSALLGLTGLHAPIPAHAAEQIETSLFNRRCIDRAYGYCDEKRRGPYGYVHNGRHYPARNYPNGYCWSISSDGTWDFSWCGHGR
ncbi:MAG TPA: hypothetical protein VIH99_07645 [Bdellovibrionota bacterium]|jgi:hypothetical protein